MSSVGWALERALGYPAGIKVRIADRMAQIPCGPARTARSGFISGLVAGLWDGLTGPFVLLWDLVKIGYEIQAAQLRPLATLADRQSRDALSRDVHAALAGSTRSSPRCWRTYAPVCGYRARILMEVVTCSFVAPVRPPADTH